MLIGGSHWSVRREPMRPEHGEMGWCDAGTRSIAVRRYRVRENERSTLLHETLHAISHEHGLRLSETAVRTLEVELTRIGWKPSRRAWR